MTERAFLQQVRDLARTLKWLIYHTHDSRRSEPGFPDVVLVRGPRLIFAELKTDTGKMRPDQEVWLESLRGIPNVHVYVWRPKDFSLIVEALT